MTYIWIFAVAMSLPPMTLAGFIAYSYVAVVRAQLEDTNNQTVSEVSARIDRVLVGWIAMLQALATSPAIHDGDFARFDLQAREVLDLQGQNIVLRGLDGQQIVNTRLARGTKLPKVPDIRDDQRVAETKAPQITGVHRGVVTDIPLIRVIVPVIFDGAVRYTLTASLPLTTLTGLLAANTPGLSRGLTIFDGDGRIVADTSPERLGEIWPGWERLSEDSGSISRVSGSGVPMIAAHRRSEVSNWMIVSEIDRAAINAPIYRSLAGLLLLALILGAVAFLVSGLIVRRIVSAQRRISAAASRLGAGRVVSASRTGVLELDAIARMMAEASHRIREQADLLLASNQELEARVEERTQRLRLQALLIETTLENMDQGLMLIEADGTVPLFNRRVLDLLDLPADLLRSRPKFTDILRYQAERNEFASSTVSLQRWIAQGGLERTQHVYERERPNGTFVEIRTVPQPDGSAIRTYTDITARKASERLAQHMARHDAMTGLPNRLHLRERLAEALSEADGTSVAVFCLDLDRFKVVNDTLGHPVGDELLKAVSERIVDVCGPETLVARLGGDEFAIVRKPGDATEAQLLAQRLIDAICIPFDINGRSIQIGTSVGVAIAPDDGLDADAIFKNADLALYQAKAAGRSAWCRFREEMARAVRDREMLEVDLRLALERHEFQLHYQPVVRFSDGTITGFEALLRWHHPVHGHVSPAVFVPIAEETGLIGGIGAWVLNEACRAALAWPASVRVLVNVSGAQVSDARLATTVLRALASTGLPPSRLKLEMTESVLMDQRPEFIETLDMLRGLGVGLALDDFGTGYSSLSYIRRFPIDSIKIDRSFVQDHASPTSAAILRAIVELGTGLGMSIVAEGVETAEQLDTLAKAGCHEVQGYLISRPVPESETGRLLNRLQAAAA